MIFLSDVFADLVGGSIVAETPGPGSGITRTYRDEFGEFVGRSITKSGERQTVTQYFDANLELMGSDKIVISGNTTTRSVMDGSGQTQFSIKVMEREDYTSTQYFDGQQHLISITKQIHSGKTSGIQYFDANEKLISAHMETDNGQGTTSVTEYGPDWTVVSKATVRVSQPSEGVTRVFTEYQADGDVTGGSVVTTKADFTLTENFGEGWAKLGSIKEYHSASKTGVQIFGPDEKMISAHIVTDNGNGVIATTDYGVDGVIVARTTVRTKTTSTGSTETTTKETADGTRVVTEHMKEGAVTGGSVVTTKPDYTLTETFGPGWTKLGAVKEVHSETIRSIHYYDGNEKLISAHVETDNGQGYTTITDYGPDWYMLSRDTVRISEPTSGVTRVVTEQIKDGVVVGAKVVTTKPDYTLTENYGADWAKIGSVKEVHTATTKSTQIYGPDEKLISAHVETSNGKGYTTISDYGPDWTVISRSTVLVKTTTLGTTQTTTEETQTGSRTVIENSKYGVVTDATVVTTRPDFTLTENYGARWTKLGSVKEMHSDSKTGTYYYDANDKLLSAHVKTDNGLGYTTVTEYGADWLILERITVKVSTPAEGVTRVTTEFTKDGVITGGSVVTTKSDSVKTETFGTGWTKLGWVKEVNSPTTKGVQYYDGDDNLISAHVETDNGMGYTTVTEYGADWHIVSRATVRINSPSEGVTRTTTENSADGIVTGGSVVIEKADFTLTETYGTGWTKLGAVKEIHSAESKGIHYYGSDDKLISAHVETDNGKGYTTVTDYGADWLMIQRTTVKVTITSSGTRTVTENLSKGVVTSASVVTKKADTTLTETYGAEWAKVGSVKEYHSATTRGSQTFDANDTMVSGHIETDNGASLRTITDFGVDGFVTAKTIIKTEMVDGVQRIQTEYQENGAGNVQWTTTRTGTSDQAFTRHFGSGVDNNFVGDLGKDTMLGNAGNDRLSGMGNDDDLRGGSGDDYLDGGAANDKLSGDEGDDTLIGGTGADTLYGGAGADTLVGGTGRDTMVGGDGADSFVFLSQQDTGATTLSRDLINDFKPSIDKIDLSAIDANGSGPGNGTFQFVDAPGAAFTGVAGQIIWAQVDKGEADWNHTLVQADINGDKIADFHIQLLGLLTLSSGDFIL